MDIEFRNILDEIYADKRLAEKALLKEKTLDRYEEAAEFVMDNVKEEDRCLIFARRAAQKIRNSRGGWVIQTQLQFIHQAELAGITNEKELYLSESQIKRKWKALVTLTEEVAGRL